MIGSSNHKQFLEQCFGHWQNDDKFFLQALGYNFEYVIVQKIEKRSQRE